MKIELQYTAKFIKNARKLPKQQKKKLTELLELLQYQPRNAKLHTKPLEGKLAGYHSFRITRDYRGVFRFLSSDTIRLIDVAHRKDVYRL